MSKLKREQWFGSITAMRLWGIPTPYTWSLQEPVDLVVPRDAYAPRSRGVRSQRMIHRRLDTGVVDGLPTLQPVAAILSASERLSNDDMVVAFDALLSASNVYPGRSAGLGIWTPERIRADIARWESGSAFKRALAALERARPGSDSPQETHLRLLLVDAGLPEPDVQVEVLLTTGRRLLDIGWPQFRVGGDYEGDHHRTDRRQWQIDMQRDRELRGAGWMNIRVSARDLRDESRARLAREFRRALRTAGWQG